MPTLIVVLIGLLPAALASAVCFLAAFTIQALWTGELKHLPSDYLASLAVFAVETSFMHAILLGTPLFVALYRLKWLRWWSSVLAGFVLASLPAAITSWPLRYAGEHISTSIVRGGKVVQTLVNGVPTLAGWLDYAKGVLIYALLGAVGGLVFWLMWRRIREALETMPPRITRR